MLKILFVCLGNICRSPMAEFIMKDMLCKNGLSGRVEVASAATSGEELGNPLYPPAARILRDHGVPYEKRAARTMTKADYREYDMIIGMDQANIRNILRICGGDPLGKVSMLMDHTSRPGNVADPWFTGDFEATWDDISEGCAQLLCRIKERYPNEQGEV